MQDAGTVLTVLRERGRKGLPCDELYRQLFNKELYLMFVDRTSPSFRDSMIGTDVLAGQHTDWGV